MRLIEKMRIKTVMRPKSRAKRWSQEKMLRFAKKLSPEGRQYLTNLYRMYGKKIGADESYERLDSIPNHMEELSQSAVAIKLDEALIRRKKAKKV
jgi:hypothetical protein